MTIQNTTYFYAIAGTYDIVPKDLNNNIIPKITIDCDTSSGGITLNLFQIADLNGLLGFELLVVDKAERAAVNNITINCFGGDLIDETGNDSLVINTNGSSTTFIPVSSFQWLGIQGLGGVSNNQYKFQVLPDKTLTHEWVVPNDVMGEVKDLGLLFNPPYIRLASGNIAVVDYCSAVMKNGLYIFECYDLQTIDPINGYWVAFTINFKDNGKLEYLTELQMTSQFWNNFYTYIVNDETNPNQLIFCNYTLPFNDTSPIESYLTTLEYVGGILVATDKFYDFGGQSALQLFNSVSGAGFPSITPNYTEPVFSGDDNFVGMMLGRYAGFVYYWDTSGANYPIGTSQYTNIVAYNVLTGDTLFLKPINDISLLTNFSPIDAQQAIVDVYSHPKGLLCFLNDQLVATNGVSADGVTAVWSPMWEFNTEVIRLDNRGLNYDYSNLNGGYASIWGLNSSSIPVSSDFIYAFDYDSNNSISVMMWRWKLDDQGSVPLGSYDYNCFALANEQNTPVVAFTLPTPNGMAVIYLITPFPPEWSANFKTVFWGNAEIQPIQLQFNLILPTNFVNNRILDTSDFGTFKNWMIYGVIDNVYNNIKF